MDILSLYSAEEQVKYEIKLFEQVGKITNLGYLHLDLLQKEEVSEISSQFETTDSIVEKTYLKVRKNSFMPVEYCCTIYIPEGEVKIDASYEDKKVNMKALTPKGPQKLSLDLPENCFDNSSAVFLLRAIAFEKLKFRKFYLFNPKNGILISAMTEITGEESVTVASQNYRCIGIKLVFPDDPNNAIQRFLFHLDYPHILIKNISGPQVIEMVEYNIK